MDALLLARIQFGFTVSFHIVFPGLTIGLASYLAVLEGLWLKTGQRRHGLRLGPNRFDAGERLERPASGLNDVAALHHGIGRNRTLRTGWAEGQDDRCGGRLRATCSRRA